MWLQSRNVHVIALRYHNRTGVEIRPYDWGGLTGVAALDPDAPSYSGTYSELIKGLQDKGYTAKKDLFGAPFDFRLNAEALQQVTSHLHLCMASESTSDPNLGCIIHATHLPG